MFPFLKKIVTVNGTIRLRYRERTVSTLLNKVVSLKNAWSEIVLKIHFNTPCLNGQWLNSVIYWLIDHCTDWARKRVTSFGRQFDFHDVIYHKRYWLTIDGVT